MYIRGMIDMPLIQIFALGGTIAMEAGSANAGVVPSVNADRLIAAIPHIGKLATLRAETLAQVGSANLTLTHLTAIIDRATSSSDVSGIVVTQGTDTMEETAFLLRCLYKGSIPIVVTGAMVNPSEPGADGPANLYNSVVAARDLPAGVYVCMDGDLLDPVYVRKTHTSKRNAFKATPGWLGSVVEGAVHHHATAKDLGVSFDGIHHLPPVAVLPICLGDDGRLLAALDTSRFSGLVVESYGAGHVSEAWREKLVKLVQTMPVVLASRTGEGRIFEQTYGYKGAEIDLLQQGLLHPGGLDSRKARLLLSLLIADGKQGVESRFKAIVSAL